MKLLQFNKDTIKDFVSRGMGIKAILQQLQIPSSSYYNLIKLFPQLDEPHQEGRTQLVFELKNELIKQAKTHTLKTKKTYIKNDIETGRQTQYVEETEKEDIDLPDGAIEMQVQQKTIRDSKGVPALIVKKTITYEDGTVKTIIEKKKINK